MDYIFEIGLRQLLTTGFGVTAPEIALIRVGGDGNRIYKITSNRESFIARIYGEQGRMHPEWVRYELELLAYLSGDGISVAAPVEARDGAWLQFIPTESASSLLSRSSISRRAEWNGMADFRSAPLSPRSRLCKNASGLGEILHLD